jgi:hypothetical protein
MIEMTIGKQRMQMPTCHRLSLPTKSLAQVLYEASPNSGWEGSWHTLEDAQRRWWQEFAEVAGTYLWAHGTTGAHLVGMLSPEPESDSNDR